MATKVTSFLGVQCLNENTNEKHTTWAKIADIIEATSEIDLPKASAGFSLLPSTSTSTNLRPPIPQSEGERCTTKRRWN
ncbi:hypothetical protein BGZ67_006941 [Mortierella alpina]|nr:hypothetical protein BGZ67_006941 [Mortierella alpina]